MLHARRGPLSRGTSVLAALVFVAVLSAVAYAVHGIAPANPVGQNASAVLASLTDGGTNSQPSASSITTNSDAQFKSDAFCKDRLRGKTSPQEILAACVPGCKYSVSVSAGGGTIVEAKNLSVEKCKDTQTDPSPEARIIALESCIATIPCEVVACNDGICTPVAKDASLEIEGLLLNSQFSSGQRVEIKEDPTLKQALLNIENSGTAGTNLTPTQQDVFTQLKQSVVTENETAIRDNELAISKIINDPYTIDDDIKRAQLEAENTRLQQQNKNLRFNPDLAGGQGLTPPPTCESDSKYCPSTSDEAYSRERMSGSLHISSGGTFTGGPDGSVIAQGDAASNDRDSSTAPAPKGVIPHACDGPDFDSSACRSGIPDSTWRQPSAPTELSPNLWKYKDGTCAYIYPGQDPAATNCPPPGTPFPESGTKHADESSACAKYGSCHDVIPKADWTPRLEDAAPKASEPTCPEGTPISATGRCLEGVAPEPSVSTCPGGTPAPAYGTCADGSKPKLEDTVPQPSVPLCKDGSEAPAHGTCADGSTPVAPSNPPGGETTLKCPGGICTTSDPAVMKELRERGYTCQGDLSSDAATCTKPDTTTISCPKGVCPVTDANQKAALEKQGYKCVSGSEGAGTGVLECAPPRPRDTMAPRQIEATPNGDGGETCSADNVDESVVPDLTRQGYRCSASLSGAGKFCTLVKSSGNAADCYTPPRAYRPPTSVTIKTPPPQTVTIPKPIPPTPPSANPPTTPQTPAQRNDHASRNYDVPSDTKSPDQTSKNYDLPSDLPIPKLDTKPSTPPNGSVQTNPEDDVFRGSREALPTSAWKNPCSTTDGECPSQSPDGIAQKAPVGTNEGDQTSRNFDVPPNQKSGGSNGNAGVEPALDSPAGRLAEAEQKALQAKIDETTARCNKYQSGCYIEDGQECSSRYGLFTTMWGGNCKPIALTPGEQIQLRNSTAQTDEQYSREKMNTGAGSDGVSGAVNDQSKIPSNIDKLKGLSTPPCPANSSCAPGGISGTNWEPLLGGAGSDELVTGSGVDAGKENQLDAFGNRCGGPLADIKTCPPEYRLVDAEQKATQDKLDEATARCKQFKSDCYVRNGSECKKINKPNLITGAQCEDLSLTPLEEAKLRNDIYGAPNLRDTSKEIVVSEAKQPCGVAVDANGDCVSEGKDVTKPNTPASDSVPKESNTPQQPTPCGPNNQECAAANPEFVRATSQARKNQLEANGYTCALIEGTNTIAAGAEYACTPSAKTSTKPNPNPNPNPAPTAQQPNNNPQTPPYVPSQQTPGTVAPTRRAPTTANGMPVPGSVLTQPYVCLVSVVPVQTIALPAGSVMPSYCLNTSANGFGGSSDGITAGLNAFLSGVLQGSGCAPINAQGGVQPQYGQFQQQQGYGQQYPQQGANQGCNLFGNLFKGSQQHSPPPVGNQVPQAPGSCAQSYQCQNNQLYVRNGQCVDQLVQQCQFGCNGNACATSAQNQCPTPPPQPDPAQCKGTWEKQTSTTANGLSCVTGWTCSAGTQPVAELTCSPTVAEAGTNVAIAYSCGNSTKVIGSGFSTTGAVASGGGFSGSAIATLPGATSSIGRISYGLACTNAQGVLASASCEVQIVRPSIALVATPSTVAPGGQSRVGWVTTGMQSCVVSSPDSTAFTSLNADNTSTTGTAQTPSLRSSMRVLLTCETLTGRIKSATTTVRVAPADQADPLPPPLSFANNTCSANPINAYQDQYLAARGYTCSSNGTGTTCVRGNRPSLASCVEI